MRGFTTIRQFLALLYGQLSGANSLRDIEASMKSHQGRLYHAGSVAPARTRQGWRSFLLRGGPVLPTEDVTDAATMEASETDDVYVAVTLSAGGGTGFADATRD